MIARDMTVREAARCAGRSEETIRRWIWSGKLPAQKRGTRYQIDARHLEEVIVELAHEAAGDGTAGAATMLRWLDDLVAWKAGLVSSPGSSAADLIIEDRHARR